MDDIEQKLKNARLAVPSAELDRRIAESVAAARRRQQASRAGFWWWAAALTATGGMAGVFVVSAHQSSPATAVYQIEAQGRLREMLLNSAATREAAPPFVFHVDTLGAPTTTPTFPP